LIAALANKLKGKVSAFVRKKPLECSVIVSIFVDRTLKKLQEGSQLSKSARNIKSKRQRIYHLRKRVRPGPTMFKVGATDYVRIIRRDSKLSYR
jgi:hypothetical protein